MLAPALCIFWLGTGGVEGGLSHLSCSCTWKDGILQYFWQRWLSKEFSVGMGLRQGCVLSPLLFSLYINGVVTRLHNWKCGVQCGGDMVPGLLFVDDMSLVASQGRVEEELGCFG